MSARQRILHELGLLHPGTDDLRGLTREEIRKVIHRRARQLLGRYHPDRNPNDAVAAELFREAARVFDAAATLSVPLPPPSVAVPASPAPPVPSAPRQGYFGRAVVPPRNYDARRAAFIRV